MVKANPRRFLTREVLVPGRVRARARHPGPAGDVPALLRGLRREEGMGRRCERAEGATRGDHRAAERERDAWNLIWPRGTKRMVPFWTSKAAGGGGGQGGGFRKD